MPPREVIAPLLTDAEWRTLHARVSARGVPAGAKVFAELIFDFRAKRETVVAMIAKSALVEDANQRDHVTTRLTGMLHEIETDLAGLERRWLAIVAPKLALRRITLDREISALNIVVAADTCRRPRARARRHTRRNARTRSRRARAPSREPEPDLDYRRLAGGRR